MVNIPSSETRAFITNWSTGTFRLVLQNFPDFTDEILYSRDIFNMLFEVVGNFDARDTGFETFGTVCSRNNKIFLENVLFVQETLEDHEQKRIGMKINSKILQYLPSIC